MDDFQFLLWLLPVVLLAPYVLGPFLLRFNHREAVQPVLHVLSESDVPPQAATFFAQHGPVLAQLGFVKQATLLLQHPSGNSRGYIALWLHRAEATTATQMATFAIAANGTRLAATVTSFVTRFALDSVLETANNPTPLTFPLPADCWSFAFPHLTDPAALFALHRQLVSRHAPGPARFLPPEGQNVAFLAARLEAINRHQAGLGILRPSTDGKTYQLSWRSAVMLAWKHAWPVIALRKSAHLKRGRELARELGAV